MNNTVFTDSKPHFEILDALRGVASITVVIFHIFEIFSGGDHTKQILNHGYLAVDFFFLLSGFVIGHAYDNRWNTMNFKSFLKRRLIRLHPMIIVGMSIGALCFYFSASEKLFPLVNDTSLLTLIGYTLLGFLLIPVTIPMDIRGWTEMYPTNGPAWSLFFEYIANILYALILRKLPTKIIGIITALAAINLIYFATTSGNGDVIGGWSISEEQLYIGFTRLSFPFLAGLLMARLMKPRKVNNAFLISSVLLVAFLIMPRIGNLQNVWVNGIYDSATIIILFPMIIFIGASGNITSKYASKLSTFLGNISYPLYIVHFPFTYIFYAWVVNNDIKILDAIPYGILLLILSIVVAQISFKFYDVPVRKWLMSKSK